MQKLQTPGQYYAAEFPGNASEHVTKDSHSSFSLGLLTRKFGSDCDEYGKIFHQDIAGIEKRYQGKWSGNALADYCWSFMTHESNAHHRRACKRKSFWSVHGKKFCTDAAPSGRAVAFTGGELCNYTFGYVALSFL